MTRRTKATQSKTTQRKNKCPAKNASRVCPVPVSLCFESDLLGKRRGVFFQPITNRNKANPKQHLKTASNTFKRLVVEFKTQND